MQSQLRHIAEVTARSPTPLPTELTRPIPPLVQWPAAIARGVIAALKATARFTVLALKYTAEGIVTAVRNPAAFKAQMAALWVTVKHEAHHFWVGSKLFASEVKVASALVRRVGRGESLSRRERLQLKRAVNDLLRMVPFIVIVIVPFAEFALPVLLKVFPNMLPSQFEVCALPHALPVGRGVVRGWSWRVCSCVRVQKAEYRQETYRKSLSVKLELHGILQEVLQDRMAHSTIAG